MLKALAHTPAGPLMIFGLSEDNINHLKEGKPIAIDLKELGLAGGRVLIIYGKTEYDMRNDLAEFIGPDTQYTDSSRGKDH